MTEIEGAMLASQVICRVFPEFFEYFVVHQKGRSVTRFRATAAKSCVAASTTVNRFIDAKRVAAIIAVDRRRTARLATTRIATARLKHNLSFRNRGSRAGQRSMRVNPKRATSYSESHQSLTVHATQTDKLALLILEVSTWSKSRRFSFRRRFGPYSPPDRCLAVTPVPIHPDRFLSI